jgi:hypothetical protein
MTWPTTKPSQPGIREIIGGIDGEVAERKMFGGLAFMLNGHIFTGIVGDELIPATKALRSPYPRRTSRPTDARFPSPVRSSSR